MSQFVNVKMTWEDNSSGATDEDGQEIQIWTDSPSFRPDIPVDPTAGLHPWMQLQPIAAGETEATVRLLLPVTFMRFRVRQYNQDGPGDWHNVSGTLATIAPATGLSVPEAPSNVGYTIVSSGVVTPPPPPPPPVDPPPPPPPPGGGTASNYVFTDQYSGVQGQNQWSYRDTAGNLLVYDSVNAKWNGDELYLAVWNGGFRHSSSGTVKGVVVRWTAPADGAVRVTGSFYLYTTPGSVTVSIKHNGVDVFSQAITNATVYPYDESFAVLQGDTIDFVSNRLGVALYNNNVPLAPTIQFTTDGTTPQNPVISSLTPATFTVPVGGTQPVVVALSSAAIAAASISLSSSDVTKVTVPASVTIPLGLQQATFSATGVAAGISTITATYNSVNKTASATAANPASGNWSNAPLGGTVLVDTPCTLAPSNYGLLDVYGTTLLDSDTTAPLSPSGCWKSRLEAFAGHGGNQLELNTPTSYREMYFGLYWRTNPQFQGRTVGNKLFFLSRTEGLNGVFLFHNGSLSNGTGQLLFSVNTANVFNPQLFGGSMDPSVAMWPNVGNGTLRVGVWHKIEAYIRASTTRTSQDGIIKWWVNGVLAGHYTSFNYCGPNGETLNRWMMTPTWDGAGDMGQVNTVAWEHWVDHLYVVGKN